jgi:hypothetical protein
MLLPHNHSTIAMSATTELRKVYKAHHCTDVSDAEYALGETKRIGNRYGWTPAVQARFVSLSKRYVKLSKRR